MDSKRVALLLLVAAVALHVTSGQLITPFQICEMQQMKLHNITGGSLTSDSQEWVEIRDYCHKHAYDNLLGGGK